MYTGSTTINNHHAILRRKTNTEDAGVDKALCCLQGQAVATDATDDEDLGPTTDGISHSGYRQA